MSGSLPQTLEGSQAPNAIELLWERHKKLVTGLFWLLAIGLFGYYGWQYYERREVDRKWSAFAAATFLDQTWAPAEVDQMKAVPTEMLTSLPKSLAAASAEQIERSLAVADDAQAPYLLWLQAVRGARTGDFEAGIRAAQQLQSRFPNHPLCAASTYPVQVRQEKPEVKDDKDPKDPKKKPGEADEPELLPAKDGSAVGMLIAHMQAAKEFTKPEQFKKPEIPADAPRYRVKLKGEYGSFVIALMTKEAPEHCRKFEELVEAKYWDGIKVDEITRVGDDQPYQPPLEQFHFGLEATKTVENRSDWDASKPSPEDHVVKEFSTLGHFAGAVAAQSRSGDSEVDHLYVVANDAFFFDMSRQVFAYVVEGLDQVKSVTQASFARAEDEQRGRGLPADNIEIETVEKL